MYDLIGLFLIATLPLAVPYLIAVLIDWSA